ncbi:unnamed protein product, partial [Mesorhabditis belari]|uniref:Uncharacterized protein n=1 Tax=Mesorhabditis belari TaxID=2138241 RepID=A0AAF3FQF1_9BILA
MTKYRYFNDSLLLQIYALYKGDDVLRLDAECAEGDNPHPKNALQGKFNLPERRLILPQFIRIVSDWNGTAKVHENHLLQDIICRWFCRCYQPGSKLHFAGLFSGDGLLILRQSTAESLDCKFVLHVVLALNRCVDFMGPQLQQTLFGGWRLLAWILPPFIYGAVVYFTCPPLVYLTATASYYFAAKPEHSIMPGIFLYNNVGVSICILFLNSLMLILMYRSHKKMNANTSKIQKVIAIQCFGISTTVMITGIFYCTIASGFIELPHSCTLSPMAYGNSRIVRWLFST